MMQIIEKTIITFSENSLI